MRWSLALALLGAACAHAPDPQRRARAAEGLEGDPRTQAAQAGVDAAASGVGEAPQLASRLQLRGSIQLNRGAGVDRGEDPTVEGGYLGARLDLRSPFLVAAGGGARRAAVDEALAELESVAVERRAEICAVAVERRLREEILGAQRALTGDVRGVLAWTDTWREAGTLDELAAARLEVEARRALQRPPPAPTPEAPPFGLELVEAGPSIGSPPAAGVLPGESRLRAAQEVARAESREASHAALPFVDMVEVGASKDTGKPTDVVARVAVGLPLEGTGAGRLDAEAARYAHLAEAERLERLRQAEVDLQLLRAFAAGTEDRARTVEAAERAEAIARRWLAQRLGEPGRVLSVLVEVSGTRQDLAESRARAGLAGCDLYARTGVWPARWPGEGQR